METEMEYTERSGLLEAKPTPVTLAWKGLSYVIDEKVRPRGLAGLCNAQINQKTLINKVSGYVSPGHLLAIMGSSGAGKSTLLDILANRIKRVTGTLLVNGRPPQNNFNRISGYVTQDDCLSNHLTVQETLQFYADLRLPSTISSDEKERKVLRLMNKLGLDKVRNTRVGSQFQRGISGGEKKRLSVGCELITDPSLIFLDEPTTGLDAFNSLCIMEMLNDLCNEGRTIVCTIHQPRSNIFDLFDQLMLLSHGSVVYFGPAKDALGYFAALSFHCRQFLNPADFFLDVIVQNDRLADEAETKTAYIPAAKRRSIAKFDEERAGRTPEPTTPVDLLAAYQESSYCNDAMRRINSIVDDARNVSSAPQSGSVYAVGPVVQTLVLARRVIRSMVRNPYATYAQLTQVLFTALLVGSIYWQIGIDQASIQDRLGALFFMATNQAFSMSASLNVFLDERNLVNRERAAGAYRTSSYFFAKTFVEAPFFLLFPVVFSCVAYWMVGLVPTAANFGIFVGNMVLFAAVSGSMFLAIGSVSPTPTVAQIIAPVLTVMFLLFAGFYVNTRSIPVYYQWVAYISFFKYAFETMVFNEFDKLTFACDTSSANQCIGTGEEELAILGMDDTVIAYNFFILAIMFIVYRLIAYLSLLYVAGEWFGTAKPDAHSIGAV